MFFISLPSSLSLSLSLIPCPRFVREKPLEIASVLLLCNIWATLKIRSLRMLKKKLGMRKPKSFPPQSSLLPYYGRNFWWGLSLTTSSDHRCHLQHSHLGSLSKTHVFLFNLFAWLFGFQSLFSLIFSLYEAPNLHPFFTLIKIILCCIASNAHVHWS